MNNDASSGFFVLILLVVFIALLIFISKRHAKKTEEKSKKEAAEKYASERAAREEEMKKKGFSSGSKTLTDLPPKPSSGSAARSKTSYETGTSKSEPKKTRITITGGLKTDAQLKKEKEESEAAKASDTEVLYVRKSTSDTWVCTCCQTENPVGSEICLVCGERKR